LRTHQGTSVEELQRDLDRSWAVQRGLQICAQNALDVATHLAASAGMEVSDYASAIDRLAEMGVLDPAFAARFRPVAGFRNLLVHGYLRLDMRRIHDLLNVHLDDFVTFAEHVERFVRRA
jgi:uncharacterized protein YutE (UPF0331/DUF86 family)